MCLYLDRNIPFHHLNPIINVEIGLAANHCDEGLTIQRARQGGIM
jgi:hypothetical protein